MCIYIYIRITCEYDISFLELGRFNGKNPVGPSLLERRCWNQKILHTAHVVEQFLEHPEAQGYNSQTPAPVAPEPSSGGA